MHRSLLALLTVLFITSVPVLAKGRHGATEALYMVPSAAEFVQHSRFILKISQPYEGNSTEKIAYVFPEVLVGEADRVIEFTRDAVNRNLWKAEGAQAACVETGEIFSCNISLDKSPTALFTAAKSKAHLKTMDFSAADQQGFEHIVDQFFSEEPAGFLTYEF